MRGSVLGSVVRERTGAPVAEATVSAGGVTRRTDEWGWFRINGLAAGEWHLSATSPGGEAARARVFVFDNAVSEVTIEMAEAAEPVRRPATRSGQGSVRVYVLRADTGEPLPGTMVTITSAPPGVGIPEAILDTGPDGFAAFSQLAPGDWSFAAHGPAGQAEASVRVFADSMSELVLQAPGRQRGQRRRTGGSGSTMTGNIRGRVVRADTGEPVADATLMVLRGAGPAPDISPLTDASGRFSLDGLPEGEWVLQAVAPDGSEGTGGVRVYPDATANVVLEL